MARGSRRDKIAALFAAPEQGKTKDTTVTKKYRVGIYVRLSVENGGLGEDSESLNNQEQLLVDYCYLSCSIRLCLNLSFIEKRYLSTVWENGFGLLTFLTEHLLFQPRNLFPKRIGIKFLLR